MAAAVEQQVVASPFSLGHFEYARARALMRGLDLPEPVAVTLVRRGFDTVAEARAFLDADECHDPFEFEGMAEVVERVRAAISAGRRITVHGDYDADGVCSTAILVGALRGLGASCDWYIPSRLGDGYGLTLASVERLGERGTELLITTDCGITCAEEVAAARAAGIEVIVTDHHQHSDCLPDCSVLHPVVSGYPCEELCATGVAYKLSAALRGPEADADLDLVALATVADLVPLRGENRALVRRGLERARLARRPGMRALMAAAQVEPEGLDEGDLSFRLAPRVNAAGRLYRADAGVELMLTDDLQQATRIATELNQANHERRDTEREVLAAAVTARGELPEELADAPGLVIAGQGWHPGVVGIVASRMVERTGRPVVLIALDGEGRGRGSGRSVPGFDLLGALEACAEHLERFGGHRAAAGLELRKESLAAFREAFAAHAREVLGEEPTAATEEIDAVVGADELGLDVARQLARLGPFGKGNPPVRLVVPAARVRDVQPMGEGERHARFSLESASGRARGVAFGVNGSLAKATDAAALDVSLRLEVNQWNGSVEPRVVLGHLYEEEAAPQHQPGPDVWPDDSEWEARVEAELERPLATGSAERPTGNVRRSIVDRRSRSGVATVAALASSGEAVLAISADALRRRALVERAAVPSRFGGGAMALAAAGASDQAVGDSVRDIAAGGGVVLADWARLARDPGLTHGFEHVVLIDPPPLAQLEDAVDRSGPGGFLHLAWGAAEVELSLRLWDAEWPSRPTLAAAYRALADASGGGQSLRTGALRAALEGPGPYRRAPEVAARALRVLRELGLARWEPRSTDGGARGLIVVSSEGKDLTHSRAYLAYRARHEEGRRYLTRRRHQE